MQVMGAGAPPVAGAVDVAVADGGGAAGSGTPGGLLAGMQVMNSAASPAAGAVDVSGADGGGACGLGSLSGGIAGGTGGGAT